MEISSVVGVKKGAWTAEEDLLLRKWIEKYGEGNWHLIPLRAGLNRCRKSCRLRWLNYLRPDIKRGEFALDEVDLIIRLHKLLGNRWSLIAGRLPGRTANDVKNYWNAHLRKKLVLHQKDKKEKAPKIVKTNIIKPQPRKVSKILTTITDEFQSGDDLTKPSPIPPPWEDSNLLWESLLLDDEGHRGITKAVEITPATKEGDGFVKDNQSGWSDSFDMENLWGLFTA